MSADRRMGMVTVFGRDEVEKLKTVVFKSEGVHVERVVDEVVERRNRVGIDGWGQVTIARAAVSDLIKPKDHPWATIKHGRVEFSAEDGEKLVLGSFQDCREIVRLESGDRVRVESTSGVRVVPGKGDKVNIKSDFQNCAVRLRGPKGDVDVVLTERENSRLYEGLTVIRRKPLERTLEILRENAKQYDNGVGFIPIRTCRGGMLATFTPAGKEGVETDTISIRPYHKISMLEGQGTRSYRLEGGLHRDGDFTFEPIVPAKATSA